MTAFQLTLLGVVVCLLIVAVVAAIRGWASRREGALWASIFAAAGVAIIWPDITVVLARTLGIGRGADLLLYVAVVAMLVGGGMIYMRLRLLRRQVTLLVRHLAITEAYTDPAHTKTDASAPAQRISTPPKA